LPPAGEQKEHLFSKTPTVSELGKERPDPPATQETRTKDEGMDKGQFMSEAAHEMVVWTPHSKDLGSVIRQDSAPSDYSIPTRESISTAIMKPELPL